MLGYVYDNKATANGDLVPLPGAHIVWFGPDGPQGAVTDQNGAYQWDPPNEAPDPVPLRVSFVGYQPLYVNVAKYAGQIDFGLNRGAVDLPEFEVFPDAPGVSVPAVGLLALLALVLAVGLDD